MIHATSLFLFVLWCFPSKGGKGWDSQRAASLTVDIRTDFNKQMGKVEEKLSRRMVAVEREIQSLNEDRVKFVTMEMQLEEMKKVTDACIEEIKVLRAENDKLRKSLGGQSVGGNGSSSKGSSTSTFSASKGGRGSSGSFEGGSRSYPKAKS